MSLDNAQGQTTTLIGIPPGGWFGEGTVLKREAYRYNIHALRKTMVAGLPADTFHWLLDHSIGFNRFIMNQLNERLGQFIAARESDRLNNPEVRVARSLAALCNPVLYPGVGDILRITQQELAYIVGLSRQRANAALQALQARGLIRVEHRRPADIEHGRPAKPSLSLQHNQLNMTDPKPTFRRATPRQRKAVRAPVPAGQTNTAAQGPNGTVRLNKRMAALGLASRREADDWIARGWVKVNGHVAEMGMQVAPDVQIEINKLAKGQQAKQVTVLINKPLGLVSGQAEDGHEPAITLVQPQNRWDQDNARFFFHPSQLKSLVPAGRLDIDSTGLLVLTQDGRVARQLIGEDGPLEKEYLVRVVYTGIENAAAATSAAATYAAPARPVQLSRIDDDDPVTEDVQSQFPATETGTYCATETDFRWTDRR
jgi:23S rRNA pseudouridine2604 synthase